MLNFMKPGVGRQLMAAVFLSVVLSASAITATLYVFGKKRIYEDNIRRSEEMVQAASLSLSRALASRDEVLLDALVHELQSRKSLNIKELYVISPRGRVMAHSNPEEYGKTYQVPGLLKAEEPGALSQAVPANGETFSVTALLQSRGSTIGAVVVTFSQRYIAERARQEMRWIIGVTVPILALSGAVVMLYGRRMSVRLKNLQEKAIEVGRGDMGAPLIDAGSDEIGHLARAFNRMTEDLSALRERERLSASKIEALNRDLSEQLRTIKELKERLADENAALREELRGLHAPGEIIGSKGGIRHLMDQARELASLPVTVLITGESGTGKELVARFLHESGARGKGPFITVNCAAMPSTLIESELFGHEKGSFTGAVETKKGKFEIADGGTLFLDEVGELPPEAQVKLLRALQLGEVWRIGGASPIAVDVRIVAATNRDLKKEVQSGKFREDLYYRLKVVELECPPLRERLEDVAALAQHFVELYSRKLGKTVLGVSPSALEAMKKYRWPGNIRELENMVARAVALAKTKVLGPEDFFLGAEAPRPMEVGRAEATIDGVLRLLNMPGPGAEGFSWDGLLDNFERVCIKSVLERSKNQKEAALKLGLTQTKLHRLIQKLGLNRHS